MIKATFTSLRVQLILLIFIIIIPLLGLILYHHIDERNENSLRALRQSRRLARNVSALYNQTIMEARQTLFTLSLIQQVQRQDADDCSQIFASLLKHTDKYTGLAIAKPNGEIYASQPPAQKPINYGDRPWFQRLIKTQGFVIGEYFLGRISGKPVIVLGHPVLDRKGRLIAILTAGLDLEYMKKLLLGIMLPEGANIFIIDSAGTILLRHPDPEKLGGKQMVSKAIVTTILTKRDGTEEGIGLDGIPRFFGYTTIGGSVEEALHIAVSIPKHVALGNVNRDFVYSLAIFFMATMLALLGAWSFGRRLIISPVNRLINLTKRVAEGELTIETEKSYASSELGQLAHNFDRMAESLKHREEIRALSETKLRESEEKYRMLFQNLAVAFALHEIILNDEGQPCDYRFLEINPAFEQHTGLKVQDLIGRRVREVMPYTEAYWIERYGRVALTGDPVHFENYSGELHRYYDCLAYSPRHGLFAVMFSDITDRKLAENKLRITQFTVDRAAEPIAWIGKDGRYLYVNDAGCHLFGFTRDEMLSMRLYDLDPAISAGDWPGRWEEIKQKGNYVLETMRRAKDGTFIPIETHVNYLTYEDKELYVCFARDIRKRKLYEEQLKGQINRLSALRTIDMAITGSLDIRVTLDVFLEQVINCLHVDAADILLLNLHNYNRLNYAVSRGFKTKALQHTDLSMGSGYAGRVAQERKIICIPNLQKEPHDLFKQSPKLSEEGFVTYHGVPLIAKGHVKGVLEIFNRTPLTHDQDWLDFLDALAMQAAIAIDNGMLFDELQKSNIGLIQAYDSTLAGWSKALDMRDKETEGHSQRVAELTVQLARRFNMGNGELLHVHRGALLHDIGKLGIPDSILLKPSQLNDEELEIMHKHPEYAYELLYPISYLRPALDIPYCHHEAWDGTGYPRRLKGEYIPLTARIFTIADVWDALCSDRPYRPAWPEEQAREYIKEMSGKQFDPKVVEVFVEVLNE